MPRDSNGNYTLPAGNPVVSGTTILATWANSTMPDLGAEMTNSLSRDGSGGMLDALQLVDGNAIGPAVSFTTEPSLGVYRPEAGVLGFAAGSAETARIKVDGNISVTGAAPVAAADLTRMDYVDANFAKYLAGYANTGFHVTFVGDLNTIAANSTYSVDTATATNYPPDSEPSAVIYVQYMAFDATGGTMLAYGLDQNGQYKQWQRQKVSSVWDVWKLVVNGIAGSASVYGTVAADGTIVTGSGNFTVNKGIVGNYLIVFDTPQADANYSPQLTRISTTPGFVFVLDGGILAGSLDIRVRGGAGANQDAPFAFRI